MVKVFLETAARLCLDDPPQDARRTPPLQTGGWYARTPDHPDEPDEVKTKALLMVGASSVISSHLETLASTCVVRYPFHISLPAIYP